MKRKIDMINVDQNSSNSGDWFVQRSFENEFSNYEWNNVFGNHEHIAEQDLKGKEKVVMVSTNMLKTRRNILKNTGPWRMKGYRYKNVVPVSIGTGSERKWWKFNLAFTLSNKLFILKPLIIILAYTLGPLINVIYNAMFENRLYATLAIKKALDPNAPISTRTQHAEDRLRSIGFHDVTTTGCITLWGFDSKVVKSISSSKKKKLVLAFTHQPENVKKEVYNKMKKHYDEIIIWHQTNAYESPVKGDRVIDNDWEELEKIFKTGEYDYFGSRLHAGIFAMKHGTRAFFVSVDHRVVNYSDLIGIKYIVTKKWSESITDELISSNWSENIVPINNHKVQEYKGKLERFLKDSK